MDYEVEKRISDMTGIFSGPIIVYPGGWSDTVPQWLKKAITLERLAMNMKTLKGEEATGTDAECCAYLYTASLTIPLDSDWSEIYLYVSTKSYEQWNDQAKMPEDVAVNSLNDYQLNELNKLKRWIYQKRCKDRKETGKLIARQNREAEIIKEQKKYSNVI